MTTAATHLHFNEKSYKTTPLTHLFKQ